MATQRPYRLFALAGFVSAAILLLNAARRAGYVPANVATHGIAPLGAALGLFSLGGLYLWHRREAGPLGATAFVLNSIGLAGATGIEVSTNYVFPYLPQSTVDSLVAGETGKLFLVVALTLLAGAVLFAASMWRSGRFPRPFVVLYAVGLAAVSLRTALPEPVYLAGIAAAAVASAGLSEVLWAAGRQPIESLEPIDERALVA